MNTLDIYIIMSALSIPATIKALQLEERKKRSILSWFLTLQVSIIALAQVVILKVSPYAILFAIGAMIVVRVCIAWPKAAKFASIPYLLVMAALWTHYLVPIVFLALVVTFSRKHLLNQLQEAYGNLEHALDLSELLLSWFFIVVIIAENFEDLFPTSNDYAISFGLGAALTTQSLLLVKFLQRLSHCNLLERDIVNPYRSLKQLTRKAGNNPVESDENPHQAFMRTVASYCELAWAVHDGMSGMDEKTELAIEAADRATENPLNISVEQKIGGELELIKELLNNKAVTELQKDTLLANRERLTPALHMRIKRFHQLRINYARGLATTLAKNLPLNGIKPIEENQILDACDMLKDLRDLIWEVETDGELVSICAEIRECIGNLRKIKDVIQVNQKLALEFAALDTGKVNTDSVNHA